MTQPEESLAYLQIRSGDEVKGFVLSEDMPLVRLKEALDAKVCEYLISQQKGTALLRDPDLPKLLSWINERESHRTGLSPSQISRLDELEHKRFSQKQLSYRIAEEKGMRVAELAEPIEHIQNQSRGKEAHKSDEAQGKEEQIVKIPRADGTGVHEVSANTDAAVLKVFLSRHPEAIKRSDRELISEWIEQSTYKYRDDSIRVFHNGQAFPDCSSRVDLQRHGPHYFNALLQQVEEGAYLLPEHLDKLNEFAEGQNIQKSKDLVELPSAVPGRFLYPDENTNSVMLRQLLLLSILDDGARQSIENWLEGKSEDKKDNQISVHRLSEPGYSRLLDAKDPELDQKLKEVAYFYDAFVAPDDIDKIKDLKSVPRLGLGLDSLPELAESLSGFTSTTSMERSISIQSAISAPHLQADVFVHEGQNFSRNSSLEELKTLSEKLLSDEYSVIDSEDVKKLMSWIEQKEKFCEKNIESSRTSFELNSVPSDAAKAEAKLKDTEAFASRLENHLSHLQGNQSQTVDGYYSEIWGADKSALAANSMGAASGGLRPMGLAQFDRVLSGAYKEHLQKLQMVDQIQTNAEEFEKMKTAKVPESPNPLIFSNLSRAEQEIHKLGKEKVELVVTQLYQGIRDFKAREIGRKPNRDNRDFEEYIIPGSSGYGGSGFGQ